MSVTENDSDTTGWAKIWNGADRVPPIGPTDDTGSVLRLLMAADGISTGLGHFTEQSWTDCMMEIASMLRISAEDSVFSIGCGAGADVYPLYINIGCRVGGIDLAPHQIAVARQAMPELAEQFAVADATDFDTGTKYSAVICMGVLLYVPLSRAGRIIELAVEKCESGGAVGFLDVPRLSTKELAIAYRIRQAGGPASYDKRYAGLDHQYYPDGWVPNRMEKHGLSGVRKLPVVLGSNGSGTFRDHYVGYKS